MNPTPSNFHTIPEDLLGISQLIAGPYGSCLQPQPCASYETAQSPGEAIASAFSVLNQEHPHLLTTSNDSFLGQQEETSPLISTICSAHTADETKQPCTDTQLVTQQLSTTSISAMSCNDLLARMTEIVFANPVPSPVNYPPVAPYQLCGEIRCRYGRKRFTQPLKNAINKGLLFRMQREFYLAQKAMSPFQRRLARAMEKKRSSNSAVFPDVYIRRTCGEKHLLNWDKLEKALHRLIIWSSEKKAAHTLNPIPTLRAIQWLKHFFANCPLKRSITGEEFVEACTCAIVAQKVVIAIEHLSVLYPTNDQFSFLTTEDLELALSSPDRIVREKAVAFLIS